MSNQSAGVVTDKPDFSNVSRSNILVDERGRKMLFPTRRDYIDLLVREGFITNEKEFIDHPELIEAVYLDWLRRGQVGCIFAQLLSRRNNRKHIRTRVLNSSLDRGNVERLAKHIDNAAQEAVADPNTEALTVLLPTVTDIEELVNLVFAISQLAQWKIEREHTWRGTTTLIGLRRQIEEGVWAEVLVLGPFQFFPPTRQGPITSIEIRTKSRGSRRSKTNRSQRAAHLANIRTDDFLTREEHGVRFKKWTRMLRSRILGVRSDERAKARVTLAVPTAIWKALKTPRFGRSPAGGSQGH